MNDGTTTKVERSTIQEKDRQRLTLPTGSDWAHVDAVISKTDTTIYVNGEKVSSEPSAYKLTSILKDESILQIGKANWGDGEYFKGWIDNFRIENRA